MSKMSQLHAELSEQANELGFETIQDAVNSGYDVDYEKGKLVRHGLGYSETVEYLTKEQEKAHEAWLKEKESVLADLRLLLNEAIPLGDQDTIKAMERAIDFVEGCHD